MITDFDIFVTLQQGDPIEERYKESVNRGAVIDQLVRCVNSYREAAVSNDPRFDHIDISEKEKVISELISNSHTPPPPPPPKKKKKKPVLQHVLTEN